MGLVGPYSVYNTYLCGMSFCNTVSSMMNMCNEFFRGNLSEVESIMIVRD